MTKESTPCVNCQGKTVPCGDGYTLACMNIAERCTMVHLDSALPQANIYECVDCGKKNTTWINDLPPKINHYDGNEECLRPTKQDHVWKLIKKHTKGWPKENSY